jgi:predicted Rdx family selenoprotein
VSAARDLLFTYQHVIEELRLVTGSKGVFDVVVDDHVLFSKHVEGRHAEPGEVLERFRATLDPDVREYG